MRRVIDWLVDSFSAKKYPWFGDEFIHPRDLPPVIADQPIFSLFEGIDQRVAAEA